MSRAFPVSDPLIPTFQCLCSVEMMNSSMSESLSESRIAKSISSSVVIDAIFFNNAMLKKISVICVNVNTSL